MKTPTIPWRLAIGLAVLLLFAGCQGESAPDDKSDPAPTDTAPPEWPTATTLKASDVGRVHAHLEWTPADDDVAVDRYKLWVNGVAIKEISGTSHLLAPLQPSRSYTVYVTALDAAGNTTASGPKVEFTTRPVTTPGSLRRGRR